MSTTSNCYNGCGCMVTDEICGEIKQCGDYSVIIWQAIGVNPCASLKVENISDSLMKIKIERNTKVDNEHMFELEPKDEIILTITSIKSVEVQCCEVNEQNNCIGCYYMCIHYPCENKCNESIKCGKRNREDWICEDTWPRV